MHELNKTNSLTNTIQRTTINRKKNKARREGNNAHDKNEQRQRQKLTWKEEQGQKGGEYLSKINFQRQINHCSQTVTWHHQIQRTEVRIPSGPQVKIVFFRVKNVVLTHCRCALPPCVYTLTTIITYAR